jgi:hypothetical protein
MRAEARNWRASVIMGRIASNVKHLGLAVLLRSSRGEFDGRAWLESRKRFLWRHLRVGNLTPAITWATVP